MNFFMAEYQSIVDLLSKGAEYCRYHVPLEQWPHLTWVALGAAVAGMVLALWGARLLRLLYVGAFMGAGAAIGIHAARALQIDLLIGLVLGAGLAGVVGHLFYRWWVGVTAGMCALLLAALISGGRMLPELEAAVRTLDDQRLGMSTGQYDLAGAPAGQESRIAAVHGYLAETADHLWNTRRAAVYRAAFVLALAWLAGLGVGLTLPRFTTIVGTSVIGVVGLVGGLGLLLWRHCPGLWVIVTDQGVWFLAGVGVFLVGTLCYQARQGRIVPAAPGPTTAA